MAPAEAVRKAERSIFLKRFAALRPQLEAALARGGNTHSVEDVLQAVADNRAFAWLGEACVVLTTIEAHPQRRVLRYWLAAGDMEELMAFRPGIEAYARGLNCDCIVESGRDGWARMLRGHGYEKTCVVLSKELS
jgi:hypothetical protein